MKKIFLSFGILAFTAANAQQKDVFDIEKHLNKKLGVIKQENISNYFHNSLPQKIFLQTNINRLHSFSASNGNRIVILPQDNMPCVVAKKQFYNMPNVSNTEKYFNDLTPSENKPGNMPNAVRPRIIISPQK